MRRIVIRPLGVSVATLLGLTQVVPPAWAQHLYRAQAAGQNIETQSTLNSDSAWDLNKEVLPRFMAAARQEAEKLPAQSRKVELPLSIGQLFGGRVPEGLVAALTARFEQARQDGALPAEVSVASTGTHLILTMRYQAPQRSPLVERAIIEHVVQALVERFNTLVREQRWAETLDRSVLDELVGIAKTFTVAERGVVDVPTLAELIARLRLNGFKDHAAALNRLLVKTFQVDEIGVGGGFGASGLGGELPEKPQPRIPSGQVMPPELPPIAGGAQTEEEEAAASREAGALAFEAQLTQAARELTGAEITTERRGQALVLRNARTNAELALTPNNVVSEAALIEPTGLQAQTVQTFTIGSYPYEVNKGPIDFLAEWLGNDQLLAWTGLTPEEMAARSRPIRTGPERKRYLFNLIKDPPSRIVASPLRSALPDSASLTAASAYLTTHSYQAELSLPEKLIYLHHLTVLSRSSAVGSGRGYRDVVEDRLLATRKLREAAEAEQDPGLAAVIEEVMWGMGALVVRAERRPYEAHLSDEDQQKIANATPFTLETPADFERLAGLLKELVKAGRLQPYVIINIKNFAPDGYLAYTEALEQISAAYHGQITFILSVEWPGTLTHDLPGAVTALRKTADAFGRAFFEEERVAVITDGGSKTRGGPPTNANHGQFSLAPLVRVVQGRTGQPAALEITTFLEMNLVTVGTTWLQMADHYGRGVFLWPASDGIIQYGANPGFGPNRLDQLPARFMAASGGKVELVPLDVADAMRVAAQARGLSIEELVRDNDPAFLAEFGDAIQAARNVYSRDDLKLGDKGDFIAGLDGTLIRFLEKPAFALLLDRVVTLGQGTTVMNIFFLMADKRTVWDLFIERFNAERSARTGELIGQQKASVFDVVYGGYTRFRDIDLMSDAAPTDPRTRATVAYARDHGVVFIGVNYGDGAYIGDIGNLDLNAQMLQGAALDDRLGYDARVDWNQIPQNVRVFYSHGGERLDLRDRHDPRVLAARFILKNVTIQAPAEGEYELRLAEGGGAVNGIFVFTPTNRRYVLYDEASPRPRGAMLVDFELAAPIRINDPQGRGAIIQSVRHTPADPASGPTFDYAVEQAVDSAGRSMEVVRRTYLPVDTLEVYGAETTVTLLLKTADGTTQNVVVRAWNLDYKAPIGDVALATVEGRRVDEVAARSEVEKQEAFERLVEQHPRILGVVGLSTWEEILYYDPRQGKWSTRSLYDLLRYGDYDFEGAKTKVRALEMRRWLNRVRHTPAERGPSPAERFKQLLQAQARTPDPSTLGELVTIAQTLTTAEKEAVGPTAINALGVLIVHLSNEAARLEGDAVAREEAGGRVEAEQLRQQAVTLRQQRDLLNDALDRLSGQRVMGGDSGASRLGGGLVKPLGSAPAVTPLAEATVEAETATVSLALVHLFDDFFRLEGGEEDGGRAVPRSPEVPYLLKVTRRGQEPTVLNLADLADPQVGGFNLHQGDRLQLLSPFDRLSPADKNRIDRILHGRVDRRTPEEVKKLQDLLALVRLGEAIEPQIIDDVMFTASLTWKEAEHWVKQAMGDEAVQELFLQPARHTRVERLLTWAEVEEWVRRRVEGQLPPLTVRFTVSGEPNLQSAIKLRYLRGIPGEAPGVVEVIRGAEVSPEAFLAWVKGLQLSEEQRVLQALVQAPLNAILTERARRHEQAGELIAKGEFDEAALLGTAAIPPLIAALGDRRTREGAIYALVAIGERVIPAVTRVVADQEADLLQRAGAANVLGALKVDFEGSGTLGVLLETLDRLGRQQDAELLREVVVYALSYTTGEATLDRLTGLLADSNGWVRAFAAPGLGNMDNPEALRAKALKALRQHEQARTEGDERVIQAVERAIARLEAGPKSDDDELRMVRWLTFERDRRSGSNIEVKRIPRGGPWGKVAVVAGAGATSLQILSAILGRDDLPPLVERGLARLPVPGALLQSQPQETVYRRAAIDTSRLSEEARRELVALRRRDPKRFARDVARTLEPYFVERNVKQPLKTVLRDANGRLDFGVGMELIDPLGLLIRFDDGTWALIRLGEDGSVVISGEEATDARLSAQEEGIISTLRFLASQEAERQGARIERSIQQFNQQVAEQQKAAAVSEAVAQELVQTAKWLTEQAPFAAKRSQVDDNKLVAVIGGLVQSGNERLAKAGRELNMILSVEVGGGPGAPGIVRARDVERTEEWSRVDALGVNDQVLRQGLRWGNDFAQELGAGVNPHMAVKAANLTNRWAVVVHSDGYYDDPSLGIVHPRIRGQVKEVLRKAREALSANDQLLVPPGTSGLLFMMAEAGEKDAETLFQDLDNASGGTVSLSREDFDGIVPATTDPDALWWQVREQARGIPPVHLIVVGPADWVNALKQHPGIITVAVESAEDSDKLSAWGKALMAAGEIIAAGGLPGGELITKFDLQQEDGGYVVPSVGLVTDAVEEYRRRLRAKRRVETSP